MKPSMLLLPVLMLNAPQLFAQEGSCKARREAKHQARQVLHQCLEDWGRDNRVNDADPGDDCTSKTQAFVTASKDLKSCMKDQKESRQEQRQEKKEEMREQRLKNHPGPAGR